MYSQTVGETSHESKEQTTHPDGGRGPASPSEDIQGAQFTATAVLSILVSIPAVLAILVSIPAVLSILVSIPAVLSILVSILESSLFPS